MTYMDKVKVSRTVNGLVELDYVQTKTDETDKSAVLLTHSMAGKNIFSTMVP